MDKKIEQLIDDAIGKALWNVFDARAERIKTLEDALSSIAANPLFETDWIVSKADLTDWSLRYDRMIWLAKKTLEEK